MLKKFGGYKKVRIFAAHLRGNLLGNGKDKFIEKTDYCTRSKYRENTIYREALILLFELKCQDKLKI